MRVCVWGGTCFAKDLQYYMYLVVLGGLGTSSYYVFFFFFFFFFLFVFC